MVFSESRPNQELRGQRKGVKVVLEERGLWRANLKLQCIICPHHGTGGCCACRIISNQPDFQAQKGMLEGLLLKQVTTSSRTQNFTVSLILSKTFGDLLNCIQGRTAIIPGLDYKKPCLFHLPLLASTRSAVMHAKPRDT